jgi:hypothetical protein
MELAERPEVALVGVSAGVVRVGVVDLAPFGGPGASREPAVLVTQAKDELLQV